MNRKRILVLGAGRVGNEIVRCLAKTFDVMVVDSSQRALERCKQISGVAVHPGNFKDVDLLRHLARVHDVIVTAMPGSIAYEVLENLIYAARPIVDISFFEEDPFRLDELARSLGIPVVVDCGVVPGLSNFLVGYESARMEIRDFEVMCGGLPTAPTPPWNYKAPFEPHSVVDLCLRPARYMRNGTVVVVDPLETVELRDAPPLGPLEAASSDGLRTLLRTFSNIPNMVDKTLRYPGFFQRVKYIRDAGGFDKKLSFPPPPGGDPYCAFNETMERLEREWKLKDTEDELTVMIATFRGIQDGRPVAVKYHMVTWRNQETGATSMSQATGYPCAAVATLLASGKFKDAGLVPPEHLGKNKAHAAFILHYLKRHGINLRRQKLSRS